VPGALSPEEYVSVLKRFFELLIPFMYRPPDLNSWYEHSFDNYKFIIHELFLYTIAVLIKRERFADIDAFLSGGFYAGTVTAVAAKEPLQDFPIFRQHLPSLRYRNQRLQLRRLSVHADLLKDRIPARGISLDDIMQTDVILYIRAVVSIVKDHKSGIFWWPETLVWSTRQYMPFEIFARARSLKYFGRISKMLGVTDRDELVLVVNQLLKEQRPHLPRWEFDTLPLGEITGVTHLGTIA
jgi:hypothetical protein